MFRLWPVENVVVIILTALGRQKDIATPDRARKTMSWMPVLDKPQPIVKTMSSTQPVRYMERLPRTSATEPESRSVQPQERAKTEAGQRSRDSLRATSWAMAGRPTVRTPVSMEFMSTMLETVPMMRSDLAHEREGGSVTRLSFAWWSGESMTRLLTALWEVERGTSVNWESDFGDSALTRMSGRAVTTGRSSIDVRDIAEIL